MVRFICGFILLTAPTVFAADNNDDVKKELKALEGKWKSVSMEAGGTTLPKDSVQAYPRRRGHSETSGPERRRSVTDSRPC
jgi:hypothetical protein